MSSTDLLVAGGGVIGLAAAWKARLSGADVTLVDPAPGTGASWAAAGMIAPVTEAHYGEEALLGLNLRSAAAWPAFKDTLEDAAGQDIAYCADGTLAVAFDSSDRDALTELHKFHLELGLDSVWLSPVECRDFEPLLAPGLRGGLLARHDHQVDPRRLVQALLVACEKSGVTVIRTSVSEITTSGDCVTGAVLTTGEAVSAHQVLLATGWQAASTPGLPEIARPPVRPVKGQILRLKMPPGLPVPRHTIRAISQGSSVYVVARSDGEIVCGATVEEQGADRTVTGGGVYSLLRDSGHVLPVLFEAELVEATAGLRPGSPDNAPMIGRAAIGRLVVATGHFRNGILLTPVTAELVAGLLGRPDAEAELPDWAEAFDPRRFSRSAAAA